MAKCYREVEADDRARQLFDHVIRQVNVTRRSHPWTDLGTGQKYSKVDFQMGVSMDGLQWKIPMDDLRVSLFQGTTKHG